MPCSGQNDPPPGSARVKKLTTRIFFFILGFGYYFMRDIFGAFLRFLAENANFVPLRPHRIAQTRDARKDAICRLRVAHLTLKAFRIAVHAWDLVTFSFNLF